MLMVSDPFPGRCLGLWGDMLLLPMVPFPAHIWLLRLRLRALVSVGDTGEVDWQGQVSLWPKVTSGWSLFRRRPPVVPRPDERGK